ncbi:MAG: ribose 5-phosphate isomerase B [Bacteroidales bacterium]|jgi:ribose 5-phosphate isomerase B|nr:ribose 5-phosphate isomerase B [Bacteroidales bacterium]MCI2122226.1 ribose 5-phosphate isomerase B [Bacteroidales bacterium]MCI2145562.1 ribose 5-phosphate isomerase B [Bacteroidales bacterium]
MKIIGFAADHAGYELKESLKLFLSDQGYGIKDFGTHSTESMDYPDVAHPLAKAIENGEADFGIAICGTGNGMAMTLNKHQGIRAGLAWIPEIASLVKRHNNANILVLPARFIDGDTAKKCVMAYIDGKFEGGRHERRINKIPAE